jgi:hypothetical protein
VKYLSLGVDHERRGFFLMKREFVCTSIERNLQLPMNS